ncbi:MAG TPA: cupredoxin domain-containing protein [Nitrososphaeraceae archaeon]|nr:cupredoxin domain-containing protein [Nitrososphaeraceae archaeon]
MGSAGKTAFGVILGIGAVTGVLCYYAFGLVAPEPGVMTYVSREPPPAGSAAVPSGSSNDSGREGSGGNQAPASSSPVDNRGENATQNVTSGSPPGPGAMGGANDTGSNATTPAATTTAAASATLTIPNGASVQGNPAYEPNPLTVKVGDIIAVENKDIAPHTVTNGKDATDPTMGKLFDTSIINAGDSAEIVAADLDPGEYAYFCSVHPYMTGTLTVQ